MAKFEALLEELSRVVVVAHGVGGKEGEREIHDLFTENKKGVLVPLSKQIQILEGHEVEVPNYTVRHLSGITLDELEIELETDIDIQDSDGKVSMHTNLKRRNPFSRKSHIKIRAKYKMSDIAEGLHLLRDKFNAKLSNALESIIPQ